MDNEDAQIGVNIVRRSLEMPMRKIAENAGKDGSVIVDTVRRTQARRKTTILATTCSPKSMSTWLKLAVIDPAKVTRGALENAASIAAMILTTEALITDLPEENAPAMPSAPPMY